MNEPAPPSIAEHYDVEAPTDDQWADPTLMTPRQQAVILSTLIEPGDASLPDRVVWPEFIADLVAGKSIDEKHAARFSLSNIERAFRLIKDRQILVVIPGDTAYPVGFYRLKPAPIALYVLGDPWLLTAPERIGIVGARAATGYGEHVAMELTSDLANGGAVIISGGAYGIDGMAHRAALAAGGRTVAFLAGGVDRFYPLGHEALLSRIADSGAVIAEVPPGSAPTKWRFLQRNRLIAAASDAVLVVEAGIRSGSLNTAGHALALGMPLGAVPGPVTSPASAGCHRIIQEGAALITSAEELRAIIIR